MLLDITNIDSHWSFNGLLWKKRNAPVSCDRGFVIYSIRISIRDTVILLIVYSNGKVFMHFYFSKSKERPLRRQPKVINKNFTTSLLSPAEFAYAHLLGHSQVGRTTGTASWWDDRDKVHSLFFNSSMPDLYPF